MEDGIAEEDLRYLKPQATEFKAIVGMNARCLNEFFNMRCCQRAQAEIRDLAWKMLRLANEAKPDLFTNSGPSCKSLGYCPENDAQCDLYKGKIPTKNDVKEALNQFFYNNASLDD